MSRQKRTKALVALGNLLSKYPNTSTERQSRVKSISEALSIAFQSAYNIDYIISGRRGAISTDIFLKFSEQESNRRVNTYIPKLEIDKSTNLADYHLIGNAIESDTYSEGRRTAMVIASDVILISDGNRGVNNILEIGRRLRKKIIPLPFGFETEAGFLAECLAFEDRLLRFSEPELFEHWRSIRNLKSSPKTIASSVVELIQAYNDNRIRREIFVTLPLGDNAKSEIEDIVDAIKEVSTSLKFEPVIVQGTDGQSPLMGEILTGIDNSEACISILDFNRPNIYYESGYAKGQGKPVLLFCKKDRLNEAAFDALSFEVNTWSNMREFKTKLVSKLNQLLSSGKLNL